MSSSATDNDSEHFSNPLRAKRSRTEPKILANGIIEFALDDVNEHITCKLCSGYFRDPVTITECLHTFCKSCLYYAFSHKFTKCPTCQVDLGTDPFKLTLSDRNVQELVDKVLFPNLCVQEMAQERRFYSSRGIELKPECEENFLDRENPKDTEARNKPSYHSQQVIRRTLICKHSFCEEILSLTMNYFLDLCIHYPGPDEYLVFSLDPEKDSDLPGLSKPVIRTLGNLKIAQLKKYLVAKLNQSQKDPWSLDILC